MVRKIYSNAIYLRKKQNERKVYQRMNNVLPTNIPEDEEDLHVGSPEAHQSEESQGDEGSDKIKDEE